MKYNIINIEEETTFSRKNLWAKAYRYVCNSLEKNGIDPQSIRAGKIAKLRRRYLALYIFYCEVMMEKRLDSFEEAACLMLAIVQTKFCCKYGITSNNYDLTVNIAIDAGIKMCEKPSYYFYNEKKVLERVSFDDTLNEKFISSNIVPNKDTMHYKIYCTLYHYILNGSMTDRDVLYLPLLLESMYKNALYKDKVKKLT